MRKTGTDPTGSGAGDRRSGPMGKIFFFAALALVVVSGLIFAPAEAKLAIHPMDQFQVSALFGDHISWYTPTNVTLWMALAVAAVFALLVLGSSRRAIVPGRAQSVAELAYGFIYKMVEDVAGKDGVKFFPYIMTLFMFIVCANFLGLIMCSWLAPRRSYKNATSSLSTSTNSIMPRLATQNSPSKLKARGSESEP